jgi:hypothetical protein
LTGAGEVKRTFICRGQKNRNNHVPNLWQQHTELSRLANHVPEFVHPWCNVKIVTEMLDMSIVSSYKKSQSVSGAGSASVFR